MADDSKIAELKKQRKNLGELTAKIDKVLQARDKRAARRAATRGAHAAKQSREDSSALRDIGELPPTADPKRRAACEKDFRRFCLTYFPERFPKQFSDDHKTVLERMEACILGGDLYALAMPRGSGKTTLVECACLFALLTGRHEFIVLIGADKEAAVDLLDGLKCELETNDALLADYPEVCAPIRALEGIANRCRGQTHNGERTRMAWGKTRITLPTIEGSPASGAAVRCYGITGRIRGAKHTKADGTVIRPTLFVADDPSTDQSAASPLQNNRRERTLKSAVLRLGGPGKKIAGFVPCTVIQHGDLAHRLLDRDENPEFQGQKFKLLYGWPDRVDLWEEYYAMHVDEIRAGRPHKKSTAFYRKNRKAMDEGARAAWKQRKEDGEMSAIQHAMLWALSDYQSFCAEAQQEPPVEKDDTDFLDEKAIAAKQNRLEPGIVPSGATRVVAFVDVQQTLLWYAVAAFADDFTGAVIEYGAFPSQPVKYFALATAQKTFADLWPKAGVEGRIQAALQKLIDENLAGRAFQREDGGIVHLSRILVDQGWKSEVVKEWARRSPSRNIVTPSKGVGITATTRTTIDEEKPKPGEKRGPGWKQPPPRSGESRFVLFDANRYKTFAQTRLAQFEGDRGSLALFAAHANDHRMIADHLTAETPVKAKSETTGRELFVWSQNPGKDNHLFDCVAGCCVAASIDGARLPSEAPAQTKRPKVKLSELRERKRALAR